MFHFKRKIYRNPGEIYLTRYYLFRTPWFGMYIHKFYVSDYPVPHDHPWNFITCPLTIGYHENDEKGNVVLRKPFRFAYRKAENFHWIKKIDDRPVWTLFIRFRKRRDWGFLTKDGWVNEETYNKTSKFRPVQSI